MMDFRIMSVRVLLASLCGLLIGLERRTRYKEAGMKTHLIVCLASALIMLVSKYGFLDLNVSQDGSRLASQVVSGVGFLGAGLIFVRNDSVSGLTTAAGIWATSGVGLAIGSGMIYIGLFASSLLIASHQAVMLVETYIVGKQYSENYTIRFQNVSGQNILHYINCNDQVRCLSYQISSKHKQEITLYCHMSFIDDASMHNWLATVIDTQEVIAIEKG